MTDTCKHEQHTIGGTCPMCQLYTPIPRAGDPEDYESSDDKLHGLWDFCDQARHNALHAATEHKWLEMGHWIQTFYDTMLAIGVPILMEDPFDDYLIDWANDSLPTRFYYHIDNPECTATCPGYRGDPETHPLHDGSHSSVERYRYDATEDEEYAGFDRYIMRPKRSRTTPPRPAYLEPADDDSDRIEDEE